MPVSKLRQNRKVSKKLTTKDRLKIEEAYLTKREQYLELDLEDLKTLRDSKTIKGTYLIALMEAIRVKELPVEEQVTETVGEAVGITE